MEKNVSKKNTKVSDIVIIKDTILETQIRNLVNYYENKGEFVVERKKDIYIDTEYFYITGLNEAQNAKIRDDYSRTLPVKKNETPYQIKNLKKIRCLMNNFSNSKHKKYKVYITDRGNYHIIYSTNNPVTSGYHKPEEHIRLELVDKKNINNVKEGKGIINLPEKKWERFWEACYLKTKSVMVKEALNLWDIKEEMKYGKMQTTINCHNDKCIYENKQKIPEIIIENANYIDLSKTKAEKITIKNSSNLIAIPQKGITNLSLYSINGINVKDTLKANNCITITPGLKENTKIENILTKTINIEGVSQNGQYLGKVEIKNLTYQSGRIGNADIDNMQIKNKEQFSYLKISSNLKITNLEVSGLEILYSQKNIDIKGSCEQVYKLKKMIDSKLELEIVNTFREKNDSYPTLFNLPLEISGCKNCVFKFDFEKIMDVKYTTGGRGETVKRIRKLKNQKEILDFFEEQKIKLGANDSTLIINGNKFHLLGRKIIPK